MKPMTKRERVEATMAFADTDRPPVYDLLVNDAAITHFSGRYAVVGEDGVKAKCEALARMVDMTRAAAGGPREPGEHTNDDGFVTSTRRWISLGIKKRPFDDEKGAKEYLCKAIDRLEQRAREIDLKQHAQNFRERFLTVQGYLGDDTVVLHGQTGTGLDAIRYQLGLELFCYVDVDEPELISEYLERHTNLQVEMVHATADKSLSPCALTFSDIACKGRLMHSPAWLRREFIPRLAKLNAAWHEHGIKCLFHSDGYLMDIMPDLIEAGIDGLNPIETVAGMSLAEVKQLYGNQIFMAGGIDISQLMSNGTPAEVRTVCREALEAACPGYFIGSTTELDNGSRLDNIQAMLETAWSAAPVRGRASS